MSILFFRSRKYRYPWSLIECADPINGPCLARRRSPPWRARDFPPGARCHDASIRTERIRVNCQFEQYRKIFSTRDTWSWSRNIEAGSSAILLSRVRRI